MSPVEDLSAENIQVTACSPGLSSGYLGEKVPVVPSPELVTLQFVDISAGGFIELYSRETGITQKIESVRSGAFNSGYKQDKTEVQARTFCRPGSITHWADVSWKST